ncbi:Predicted ATPase [Amycolatopsis arida]|uniref:Predicted ATPase n=1 Tax=Amycolatopsis arida TaxID=587909 RepID=A0A1I5UVV3_9PSEU|nr:AAA family ATPase [Amycolatopsis arida]TDX91053.1 putative ATPase [Amycolatopsis arida]SFP99373.1 Predicted ATPase [Amycolatopsis arida]
MLTTVAVRNYRSLRDLVLPLSGFTVVTGANGSGKSNLYRALRLLADAARNGAVAALAREGGLPSTLWAGPEVHGRAVREGRAPVQPVRRSEPVGLRLGFAGDEFGYALDLGLPVPEDESEFNLDPEVKRECVWRGPVLRPATLVADRAGPRMLRRDESGGWAQDAHPIGPTDSMLSQFADPRACPELLIVRERLRSWRFYDHFRTDADAPARQSRIGTRTPVLDHDGGDLAPALRTIQEFGDGAALGTAIDNAFPGSRLEVFAADDGRFDLRFHQHGLLRPLGAAELSDGTLRYLLWVAALLSPRPPELLVLNEPETSLHPDLVPALAALIATAAERTQLVVVSHSELLVRAVTAVAEDATPVELVKELGATQVVGQGRLDRPSWQWPKR